jgi:WD40 repeat protein/class 3 adenylate cyclase
MITFLFTDIEGSTRLWERDPVRMRAALERHNALLHAAIEQQGGEVFKTVGDAFCAAFSNPADAARAAEAAQRALLKQVPEFRVRMAIHTGEAEAVEGDYLGPALNRVARLLTAGHGGQILLSQATAEAIGSGHPGQPQLRRLGTHQLRDLELKETIFQLQLPDLPARFPPLNTLDIARRQGALKATALFAVVLAVVTSLALLATANARELRRNLYAADMNVAQQALLEENLDGARSLLDRYLPAPGQEDLRTFEWRYLRNECQDRSLRTLTMPGEAPCPDFSPDGKILAVVCEDRKVHLYDAATRQELSSFPPFDGAPRFVAFSPDGRTLAVHCLNDRVFVCDLAARRTIYSIPSRCSGCASLAFSPDGRLLAATAPNGRVLLWDMQARRAVRSVASGWLVGVVAFSPRGRVLAMEGPENALRLHDLSSGSERILPCGDLVTSLAFSRDGRRLAAGLAKGGLRLWDVASEQPLPAPPGHRIWVYSVAFSPDGRRLATASSDSTVRLWDLATRREAAHLRGHRGEVVTVRFAPDGRTLASACADRTVKLWDAAPSARNDDFSGVEFALSLDGRRLAVQRAGETGVVLVNLVTGRSEGRLPCGRGASAPLCFSPRGDLLYVATTIPNEGGTAIVEDEITIWSVADRRPVARIPAAGATYVRPSLSPDGRFLALGNRIIDLAGRRCTSPVRGDFATFSPDGRLLATCGDPDILRLYEAGTWRPMPLLRADRADCPAFSPDGRLLATKGANVVQVWDTTSWKPVAGFQTGPGYGVAFSPDGRTLATFLYTPVCRLWNTRTWRPTLALKHPAGGSAELQFTSDGAAVATMGNGLLHFWRAPFLADADAER